MEVEGKKSYLPEEWGNEERMRVLMGPMPAGPQEEVARAARCTFWAAAVHAWCQATLKPSFTLTECQAAFRRGTQVPQCLPDVLQHMMRQGEVTALQELSLGERRPESWLGWGRRVLVAQPSQMAWTHLKRVVGMDGLQNSVLVCVALLQEICSGVLELMWRQASSGHPLLTPIEELYTQVRGLVGSLDNLHLVVEAMVGDGRATSVTHQGTTYIKFVRPGAVERPSITKTELAESDLRQAKERVEASLARLGEERETLRVQAKAAVASGAKTEALSLLRRRKRLDKSMETQLGVLENLSSWLHHLQETETNRQVLGALRGGVEALRTALAGDNSPDAAANTLDDLQQVLEECDDLNSMVARNPLQQEDESALEEELAGLLLHDDTEEGQDSLSLLPDVPTQPAVAKESPQPHLAS